MVISDKDRSIQVRDTLRAAWDKLHDEKNGFGVHSDSIIYKAKAQKRAVELAESLAHAEAVVLSYDQPE